MAVLRSMQGRIPLESTLHRADNNLPVHDCGEPAALSTPCKQALRATGGIDNHLHAFRGVLHVCKNRRWNLRPGIFHPSSSRALLSSRRFRAFFGVTLAFSLHCLPFRPQCLQPVHTYPLGGIRRTEKDRRLSMVLFSCSASASHGLKSAPIDPFSTAHTGSFLPKMPYHRQSGTFEIQPMNWALVIM